MSAYSIKALQSVNAQFHAVLNTSSRVDYPMDSNGEFYNLLGAIPMIGQNDTSSEIFYKDDVTSLTKFCNDVGVKITSMWSINRDKPTAEGKIGSKNSLYLDTRLPNIKKYEFSDLLRNQRN